MPGLAVAGDLSISVAQKHASARKRPVDGSCASGRCLGKKQPSMRTTRSLTSSVLEYYLILPDSSRVYLAKTFELLLIAQLTISEQTQYTIEVDTRMHQKAGVRANVSRSQLQNTSPVLPTQIFHLFLNFSLHVFSPPLNFN